jgi:hypothetical protein
VHAIRSAARDLAALGATALAVLILASLPSTTHAQDIEPRAYSNAPVGVNFVIAGAVATRGGVAADASVPFTDANLRTSTVVLAYARVLDLGGKSGKFDMIVPYTRLDGSAIFQGAQAERDITGFGRPAFRMSINFLGAPALSLQEFRGWKQDLIVGASLQVSPPWSQYDWQQARQYRQQPMVLQARNRGVEGDRAMDARSPGGGHFLHRQQ